MSPTEVRERGNTCGSWREAPLSTGPGTGTGTGLDWQNYRICHLSTFALKAHTAFSLLTTTAPTTPMEKPNSTDENAVPHMSSRERGFMASSAALQNLDKTLSTDKAAASTMPANKIVTPSQMGHQAAELKKQRDHERATT